MGIIVIDIAIDIDIDPIAIKASHTHFVSLTASFIDFHIKFRLTKLEFSHSCYILEDIINHSPSFVAFDFDYD